MNNNDNLVSRAFSNQAVLFDRLDQENKLTEHLRNIYREEVMRQSLPEGYVLELNCGTGVDTIYFAEQGLRLLSTDNAPGMIAQLQKKIRQQHFEDNVTIQRCSFTELDQLGDKRFDYIISNFGGLNCTGNLNQVLGQFKNRLHDDGKVTMVIMPKISPWEMVMALKGDFKTAFRRFKKQTPAHVEGTHFFVYYYNPSYVIKTLKKDFKVLTVKGIYFAVPPEFYQRFVERYPKMHRFLKAVERKLGNWFPFNVCCDHYMITLQKK